NPKEEPGGIFCGRGAGNLLAETLDRIEEVAKTRETRGWANNDTYLPSRNFDRKFHGEKK
ncbi:MAG: hypothetical protein DRJ08_03180, partial [Acidobacteria bacterium]